MKRSKKLARKPFLIYHKRRDNRKRLYGVYLCYCGTIFEAREDHIKSNKTKSCGCFRIECGKVKTLVHGETNKTVEYKAWAGLKERCFNKKNHKFNRYGGRGITVCKRWITSYSSFLKDMGRKPTKTLSLDRINNNGDYKPSNCRWATAKQQANNK